ncbi:MAG: ferredoxin [Bacteroidetes bacterium HGW-Bacteroidetes-21]|jgi:uncharacterized ferredoxin-like protein|nr:MAG: ferredoxin [Bacteroidetes bacterium HGW-Bacteroidetes-21]
MTLRNEKEFNKDVVLEVAQLMAVSARTAPKARGNDNLEIILADGETLELIAKEMESIADETGMAFFRRDAGNIRNAHVIVFLGTYIKTQGLKHCGMCGFDNCAAKEKYPNTPCIYNTHDLGIAVGSACSVAAAHHIDNRVMFSAGQAALKLNLFPKGIKVAFGIPLSATSKSPFFDRPAV